MSSRRSSGRLSVMRFNRTHKSLSRGVTAVEVSLVSPIFLLAVFGTIELSRVTMIRNLAQDASYEAARACMVDGATTAEALQQANQVLGLLGTQGATVTINDGVGLNANSQTVKVDVNIPLSQNSLVLPWIFSGKSINATTALKTERYDGYYQTE